MLFYSAWLAFMALLASFQQECAMHDRLLCLAMILLCLGLDLHVGYLRHRLDRIEQSL